MPAENITVGYNLLKDSITNTSVFGLDWILPTFLIVIVCIIITRDINKWKIIAFPTSILLGIAGLWTNPVIIILLGLVFAVETISTQTIGNVIDTLRNKKEKAIIREELGRRKREDIKRLIKKGQTNISELMNKDINKAIALTKGGFEGGFSRYIGLKRSEKTDIEKQIATDLAHQRMYARTNKLLGRAAKDYKVKKRLMEGIENDPNIARQYGEDTRRQIFGLTGRKLFNQSGSPELINPIPKGKWSERLTKETIDRAYRPFIRTRGDKQTALKPKYVKEKRGIYADIIQKELQRQAEIKRMAKGYNKIRDFLRGRKVRGTIINKKKKELERILQ